jgi:hypothetical protein
MNVCTITVNLQAEAANHLLADAPNIMKSCDWDSTKFCEEICCSDNKVFVLGHTPHDHFCHIWSKKSLILWYTSLQSSLNTTREKLMIIMLQL